MRSDIIKAIIDKCYATLDDRAIGNHCMRAKRAHNATPSWSKRWSEPFISGLLPDRKTQEYNPLTTGLADMTNYIQHLLKELHHEQCALNFNFCSDLCQMVRNTLIFTQDSDLWHMKAQGQKWFETFPRRSTRDVIVLLEGIHYTERANARKLKNSFSNFVLTRRFTSIIFLVRP